MWVDGYEKCKIYDLKNHAFGKLHEKALRPYKASIVKLPTDDNQKEIVTSVSVDEVCRLKRKAYMLCRER